MLLVTHHVRMGIRRFPRCRYGVLSNRSVEVVAEETRKQNSYLLCHVCRCHTLMIDLKLLTRKIDTMNTTIPNIPCHSTVLRNLKQNAFKRYSEELDCRITSLVTYDCNLLISVVGKGILMFSVTGGKCQFIQQLHAAGNSPKCVAECQDSNITCYQLSVSAKYLIYIKDNQDKLSVCLHNYADILDGLISVKKEIEIFRQAPLVVDHELDILCIGSSAWSVSWTTHDFSKTSQETNETCLHTIDLNKMEPIKTWKVVENSVYLLHLQKTDEHNMLGIADSRTGLCVYDLRQEENDQYVCLYQVPVDEIRNFHLVGNFVAVFHKFQPNVTFWNMKEQKTILCINIQNQMHELVVDSLEDDEEDCGLCEEDDDYVTCVTSVQSDGDHLLIYGTKSGCIFGMSVNKRLTLFNIPCPLRSLETCPLSRRAIQGLQFMAHGILAVIYEKCNLTIMDFSLEEPADNN